MNFCLFHGIVSFLNYNTICSFYDTIYRFTERYVLFVLWG